MLSYIWHSNFLTWYFSFGFLIAIISDTSIRKFNISKPFTSGEMWACILVWPIVLIVLLKGFFGDQD